MGVDIEQLIKILNMTQSDNDNEALTAIRMANRILKKHDSGWAAVIVKVSSYSREEEKKKEPAKKREEKTTYKDAPRKFDRGFWNTASQHDDWLKGLTEDSQKTVQQLRIYVIMNDDLPDRHWKNFKEAWDEYAKRSRR